MVGLNGSALPSFEIEEEYHSSPITAKADQQNDDPNPANHYAPSSPRRMRSSQISRGPNPLLPRSLKEALQLAELLSKSKLIPKGFETPETCLVGILYGMEVGLSPIAALQRMAVIDGRPTIWGDAALALVQASGLLQSIEEEIVEKEETDNRKILTAICKVKREGRLEPTIGNFSVEDAKRAGLWQKPGPWTDYPKRMLTMRARAFALRDAFPDVLAGLYIREEFEGAEKRYGQQSPVLFGTPSTQYINREDAEWEQAQVLDQKENSEAANAASETASGNARIDASAPIRRAPPPPPEETDEANLDLASCLPTSADDIEALTSIYDDERGPLDTDTLLDLFDSVLCCALDLPTFEEIVDEFAERLRPLPREIQERAQGIIEWHRKRVDELDHFKGAREPEGFRGAPEQGEINTEQAPSKANPTEEQDLPRGLRALLPKLGLGSMPLLKRRQKNRGRQARSLASWNARHRLQEYEVKNANVFDNGHSDETEGTL